MGYNAKSTVYTLAKEHADRPSLPDPVVAAWSDATDPVLDTKLVMEQ